MEGYGIIVLVVGGILALAAAIWLLIAAFSGAVSLFAFAAEQGFIGIAAYIACWVFLFPAMLIICIIVGFFTMWANRGDPEET